MKYKIIVEVQSDAEHSLVSTPEILTDIFNHLPLGYSYTIEELSVEQHSDDILTFALEEE